MERHSQIKQNPITIWQWKKLQMLTISLQKDWKDSRIQNLGEFHDLYQQIDTLLSANVFKNFCNKCTEISEPDTVYFLSAPTLAWRRKQNLSWDSWQILICCWWLRKASEIEYVTWFIGMQKPTTNTWKIMAKSKTCHISCTRTSATWMDRQFQKSCLYMVLNGENTSLHSKKIHTRLWQRQW